MIETVTIESCAGGRGHGVAHARGLTLFVPGTMAGDVVELELPASPGRRRWTILTASRLVQPSPHRVKPACVHACDDPALVAVACGGCPWMNQHLDSQRAQKLGIVARAFSTAKRPVQTPSNLAFFDVAEGSRCRARMNASDGRMGFFAQASHRIVDVSSCPMLRRPGLHNRLRPFIGPRTEAELRLLFGADDRVHLSVNAPLAGDFNRLREAIPNLAGVRIAGVGEGQDGIPVDTPGFGPITVSSDGFFQAGPLANELILRELDRCMRSLPDPGPVLECYAGSGNLSRVLRRHADVLAVESDPGSACFFERNLQDHPGPGRATLLQMSVGEAILGGKIATSPRTIVLDPPREGIEARVNAGLLGLDPRTVLLISCDPMNGARDASVWLGAGYERWEMIVLDTMPNTQHFEIIQLLEKP